MFFTIANRTLFQQNSTLWHPRAYLPKSFNCFKSVTSCLIYSNKIAVAQKYNFSSKQLINEIPT